MAFDWLDFFDAHRIEYATSGPNVGKHWAAIHCPFCGVQDPSQHMGVNLHGRGWHCWRNADHSGGAPPRLIQALIGCSFEHAYSLAYSGASLPDDVLSQIKRKLRPIKVEPPILHMPPEFRPLSAKASCAPFVQYLRRRGFPDYELLCSRYDLRYCLDGEFRGRVIFPVTYEGKLVSWTGRTIDKRNPKRYRALDVEKSVRSIRHCLLWYDDLMKSKAPILLLCEGPFDALKVDVLGRGRVRATCFFTSSPSTEQIGLLWDLAPRFDRRILLLDRGTVSTGMKVMQQLVGLDVEHHYMPAGIKDPGNLKSLGQIGL